MDKETEGQVPDVRPDVDPLIAVLFSDAHWSHIPPIARSAEPDWYETQTRYMLQLQNIRQRELFAPLILAGDLLAKPNEPAEFINFLIRNHPEVWAIPGQHDLPYHRYQDLHKSVFWTLVEAGTIKLLKPGEPNYFYAAGQYGRLVVHAFPFGFPIKPCPKKNPGEFHIAVIHSYIWIKGFNYKGALDRYRLRRYVDRGELNGYHLAVFGDNHKGFDWCGKNGSTSRKIVICNVGTLMRRFADELDYRPSVVLLYNSGKIQRKYLDISEDRVLDSKDPKWLAKKKDSMDIEQFVHELEAMEEKGIDLEETLKRYIRDKNVSKSVADFLLGALP